ncbi:MAG: hypothetical protein G5701_10390, partial [Serratia symbiotica]|nr:hypothetical protein [Serratia symbiotica]
MSEYIYVTAVIDAKDLYKDFKNKSPSKDPTKPTPINHTYGFLFTEGKFAVDNTQGTADLTVKAKPGDSIRFSATSESNNFEQVVILYGISESECWTTPQFISNYKRPMVLPSNSKITDFTA